MLAMKSDLPTGPGMDRFNATMDKILSVSHEEMQRRLAAHKAEVDRNPKKRGPKPRPKSSVSSVPKSKS
jgi:hypothetical protein